MNVISNPLPQRRRINVFIIHNQTRIVMQNIVTAFVRTKNDFRWFWSQRHITIKVKQFYFFHRTDVMWKVSFSSRSFWYLVNTLAVAREKISVQWFISVKSRITRVISNSLSCYVVVGQFMNFRWRPRKKSSNIFHRRNLIFVNRKKRKLEERKEKRRKKCMCVWVVTSLFCEGYSACIWCLIKDAVWFTKCHGRKYAARWKMYVSIL